MYTYDEWGYVKRVICGKDEEKLANTNPIRYRGYYYDTETGYYYLQSRYYVPSICRFINSDIPEIAQQSTEDINGLNLFTYCCDDPINNVDFDGYKYNPIKAKAYAEKWWESTNPAYGRNPSGDCANFVSQCLYAGGLNKMTGALKWGWHCHKIKNTNVNGQPSVTYDRSRAWAAAQNLYDWLHSTNHTSYTYVLKKKSDVDNIGRILYSKPTCAAAIFFSSAKSRTISHAAISGQVVRYKNMFDVYYYAHSVSRNGKRYYGKKREYNSLKDFLNKNKGASILVCLLK